MFVCVCVLQMRLPCLAASHHQQVTRGRGGRVRACFFWRWGLRQCSGGGGAVSALGGLGMGTCLTVAFVSFTSSALPSSHLPDYYVCVAVVALNLLAQTHCMLLFCFHTPQHTTEKWELPPRGWKTLPDTTVDAGWVGGVMECCCLAALAALRYAAGCCDCWPD